MAAGMVATIPGIPDGMIRGMPTVGAIILITAGIRITDTTVVLAEAAIGMAGMETAEIVSMADRIWLADWGDLPMR